MACKRCKELEETIKWAKWSFGTKQKKENAEIADLKARIATALDFLEGEGETGWIIEHARKALRGD